MTTSEPDPKDSEVSLKPSTALGAGFAAILVVVAVGIALLVVGRVERRSIKRYDGPGPEDRRVRVQFMAQLSRFAIVTVGVISFLHVVPVLRPVGTAMLASAGVLTVVVGLAAQGTLGNLVAGVSILMYHPFRAGDRIQVEAPTGVETGVVESVTLGNTVIVTFDNRRIVVPNGQMISSTIVNLSAEDPRQLAQIHMAIAPTTPVARAKTMLSEAVAGCETAEEVAGVAVTRLNDYSITLTAYVWCKDSRAAAVLEQEVLERMVDIYARAGFKYPTPTVSVVVHQDDQVARLDES